MFKVRRVLDAHITMKANITDTRLYYFDTNIIYNAIWRVGSTETDVICIWGIISTT